jgi:hypothetical protein
MKKKPTYTTKLHAHRLTIMMGRRSPCGCCPAAKEFNPLTQPSEMWSENLNPCFICQRFVSKPNDLRLWTDKCPCIALGEKKALKRTNEALNLYYKKES